MKNWLAQNQVADNKVSSGTEARIKCVFSWWVAFQRRGQIQNNLNNETALDSSSLIYSIFVMDKSNNLIKNMHIEIQCIVMITSWFKYPAKKAFWEPRDDKKLRFSTVCVKEIGSACVEKLLKCLKTLPTAGDKSSLFLIACEVHNCTLPSCTITNLWMCGKGLIGSRDVVYSAEKTQGVVPSGSLWAPLALIGNSTFNLIFSMIPRWKSEILSCWTTA